MGSEELWTQDGLDWDEEKLGKGQEVRWIKTLSRFKAVKGQNWADLGVYGYRNF